MLTRHSQKCGGIVELVLADLVIALLTISCYHEPVVDRGPFVMNTRAQIFEAFSDYSAGLFDPIVRSSNSEENRR